MATFKLKLSVKGLVLPQDTGVEDFALEVTSEYSKEEILATLQALPEYMKNLAAMMSQIDH